MTFASDPLDRLAPALDWAADWDDVLRRAGEARGARVGRRPFAGRRLAAALAVLALLLLPLAAFGAASHWWFLRAPWPPAPTPNGAVVVVREGKWDGHPWKLVAYRSDAGLCWSFIPIGLPVQGEESSFTCAPFAGIADKPSPNMTISAMGSSGGHFRTYVAGVVVESAQEVDLRFGNGETLRLPTFAAGDSVGPVRFFATQVPTYAMANSGGWFPRKLTGLNRKGKVVACLGKRIVPLSACK